MMKNNLNNEGSVMKNLDPLINHQRKLAIAYRKEASFQRFLKAAKAAERINKQLKNYKVSNGR